MSRVDITDVEKNACRPAPQLHGDIVSFDGTSIDQVRTQRIIVKGTTNAPPNKAPLTDAPGQHPPRTHASPPDKRRPYRRQSPGLEYGKEHLCHPHKHFSFYRWKWCILAVSDLGSYEEGPSRTGFRSFLFPSFHSHSPILYPIPQPSFPYPSCPLSLSFFPAENPESS